MKSFKLLFFIPTFPTLRWIVPAILLCSSFAPVVSAAEPQNAKIDSLLSLLKTDKEDTGKVNPCSLFDIIKPKKK